MTTDHPDHLEGVPSAPIVLASAADVAGGEVVRCLLCGRRVTSSRSPHERAAALARHQSDTGDLSECPAWACPDLFEQRESPGAG